MQIQISVQRILGQLSTTVSLLDPSVYAQPCKHLSNGTIGQHTRHIIEMFQCLLAGYEDGTVNYEKRPRDLKVETEPQTAVQMIRYIYAEISRADRPLKLEATYQPETDDTMVIDTNFYREIAYNLEHTIHHMALIKVGILELADLELPESFGVAPSTLKYRKACVQ